MFIISGLAGSREKDQVTQGPDLPCSGRGATDQVTDELQIICSTVGIREGQLILPEERGASRDVNGRQQKGPLMKLMIQLLIFLSRQQGMLLPSRR